MRFYICQHQASRIQHHECPAFTQSCVTEGIAATFFMVNGKILYLSSPGIPDITNVVINNNSRY